MPIRLTFAAVAASLAISAGLALGLTDKGQAQHQDRDARTGGPRETPIARIEAPQLEAFAVLRDAPRPAPAVIRDSLASDRGHGLNPALAHRARLPLSGRWAWIVPGRGFLCILIKRGFGSSSGCDTTAGAVSDGVGFAILYRRHGTHVDSIGLVRDGVTRVHGAAVVGNVYEYEAARLAR